MVAITLQAVTESCCANKARTYVTAAVRPSKIRAYEFYAASHFPHMWICLLMPFPLFAVMLLLLVWPLEGGLPMTQRFVILK